MGIAHPSYHWPRVSRPSSAAGRFKTHPYLRLKARRPQADTQINVAQMRRQLNWLKALIDAVFAGPAEGLRG